MTMTPSPDTMDDSTLSPEQAELRARARAFVDEILIRWR